MSSSEVKFTLMVTKDALMKGAYTKVKCQQGYKQLVSTYEEAHKVCTMFRPSIAFIDQSLPDDKGEKLVSDFHKKFPETITVYLVEHLTVESVFRIWNKANELLRKPVSPQDIQDMYDKYCTIPKETLDPCPIAEKYIAQSFSNPNLSEKFVAQELGLSPEHLSRLFKAKTGRTFHETLCETRIQKARKMLMESDLLVKQIAYKVGYSRVDIFIKNFQKRFGISPATYRKNNLRKNHLGKVLIPLIFLALPLV